MPNNRSDHDPTNDPTNDDLMARKPTTKKDYDEWMRRNKYAKTYEHQLRQKAIDEEREKRQSLIKIWREGGAS